ncbi:Suppressor of cytokine signaling 1 [Oryzias melastigma]|uniref:Suppressor of cytokine signaling 1 n=1 Tax=Oryzias melastigma TaxID=30732 RepID=A0A3B3B757_ORYME|nr:suppressor of cytokine signaling 1 [Oryzias melastigma]XP_036067878.1 suppressor of cytokine signaling 1 [Oryzias melastigma]XP_036067880.1 suppressor of cytokine signaling 1 [Oryzias melastigma]KAF6736438.1 Suppressor of cytokine signaling 1 [Oryzias melastigma]
MVRDSLSRTATQCQKQNNPAETENPSGEEGAGPEQSENPDRQSEPLLWNQPVEESKPWIQPETGADADFFTHLRPFSSEEAYTLVRHTYQQLQHSGFYWGPITMEEAHEKLSHAPIGTFLIRDSGQPDVFFTLSYQSEEGPTSVRIILDNLHFNLYGSLRTFPSLFALLTYYTSSSCKLTEPYRKQRPERLKQMCRRALIRAHGSECTSTLSGLSVQTKAYVLAYPHCI